MIWKSRGYILVQILFCLLLGLQTVTFAQNVNYTTLNVIEYQLDNGLKVYLNPDPYSSSVTGMVAVRTGSKYDPSEATGIAHYLEHMLFKGTDKLGTVDYEKEVVFLDSIQLLYDSLAVTKNPDQRLAIQSKINKLSLKAGEYAIPNELDLLLDNLGSQGVNAFTGYEMNAYFNLFPANQMENWLKIYSHRFLHPVFRLFQSELETVFEEKNMYLDQFEMQIIETFAASFYKKHPYGQQTILGKAEHIKNPSLTKMQAFYDQYYVANNMALILSGPFDVDDCKLWIETYFSQLPSGDIPEFNPPKEIAFQGQEKVTDRLTPIRVSLIGFRTVPMNHEDKIALDVLSYLLSNPNSTGQLDMLGNDRKLMYSMAINDMRQDESGSVMLIVPKIVFQSMKKAEKLVLNEIESIKMGEIDAQKLDAVKKSMMKEDLLSLESPESRVMAMMESFIYGQAWEDRLQYSQKVEKITVNDIVETANQYYGADYLLFRSRMGFSKKEKLDKPGYDPVKPAHPQAKSEFAQSIIQSKAPEFEPNFLEENEDYQLNYLSSGIPVYYCENPVNDVFELTIRFRVSKFEKPALPILAAYLNQCGTVEYPSSKYQQKLQNIAAEINISSEDNYFSFELNGMEDDLDTALYLLNSLMQTPNVSKSDLKRSTSLIGIERRYEKQKPDIKARALAEYVIYGDKSSYLTRPEMKTIRKLDPETLIAIQESLFEYPCEVHYSGKINLKEIESKITHKIELPKAQPEKPLFIREILDYDSPCVYFLNDKKALQSQIYFYIPGSVDEITTRAKGKAFNRYFGVGMGSVVFQEIRELRSMAYTAWANYFNGETLDDRGFFKAYIGTQSDKTVEAIQVMDSLLTHCPWKEDRIPILKNAMKQSMASERPDFRRISYLAADWTNQGYNYDPQKTYLGVYNDLDIDALKAFHSSHILGKARVIVVVGNKNHIDFESLERFGLVIEVNEKEFMQ